MRTSDLIIIQIKDCTFIFTLFIFKKLVEWQSRHFYVQYLYFKNNLKMYQLSQNLLCHTRDLRCLDYNAGVLVTGGSDKVFKMFSVSDGKIDIITTHDIFQKNILSIRINRRGGDVFVLVGSADGKIHAFDRLGSPIGLYQHNSPISSIDFIDNNHFVTGSWDGKAIVWQISTNKKISEYSQHKHAVAVMYNTLNDQIISASQDKALNAWSWKDGKRVLRKENVHGDIIRQISLVNQIGFITCSNDEKMKLWSSELEQVQTFTGHTSFVFTVKALDIGHYYSGGDDKCLKIWNNEEVVQTIQFPASIWSIAIGQNQDIYAGCSDGFLRVFTKDSARRAKESEISMFNKEALDSASKKSGMSAEQIQKLPTTGQMSSTVGKKDGQIRVFRNGNIPEAFMWQAGKWEKIGEVITENNQGNAGMTESRYYPGDKYFEAGEYDYIFDVDDQSGQRKVIPYNDGGNALEAAEKYCMREGLSKGYIDQIRQFLMANASKIPRRAVNKGEKKVDLNNLRCTPQCICVDYTDIKNPTALLGKITEFNNKLEGGPKLSDKEIGYCERIAKALENSKTYHSWKLDFKELDTLKKLLTWPKEFRVPVWDMIRAFLCHYQSQAFFSGLDAGIDIISQLAAGLQAEYSQPIYALIFKTLANTMIQNTNKNGLIKHGDIVFSSVENFSNKRQVTNKNLQAAIAGFLFNYSVIVNEKKVEDDKCLGFFTSVLQKRLSSDTNEDNRALLLQAGANMLYRNQNSKQAFSFLEKYLQGCEASKDIQLLLS